MSVEYLTSQQDAMHSQDICDRCEEVFYGAAYLHSCKPGSRVRVPRGGVERRKDDDGQRVVGPSRRVLEEQARREYRREQDEFEGPVLP